MFADNTQISGRQFFRQIVTGLLGIYFLVLPGLPNLAGWQGILALFSGMAVYWFLCIYFIRIKTVFQNPERYMGKTAGRIFVFLYLSWLWLMGVYLLLLTAGITERFLIEGSISWAVIFLAGLASYLGSHQGLERRGRMAEVCFPVLFILLAGMLLLALPRIKIPYLMEMGEITPGGWAEGTAEVLCMFLPFMFLPAALGNVKKAGETGKVMAGAMGLITGLLAVSILLMQGIFGLGGYEHKEYPMIDLMAGVRLPGDFLERVDVFWVAAVLFSVLFCLGSVFFYNHELLARTKLENLAVFPAFGIIIAAEICEKMKVPLEMFLSVTIKFYGPLFLILLLYAGISGKKKRILAKGISVFLCVILLAGCGVSLEDRVFPLSMSVDYRNGKYEVIYGIPKLSKVTGQDKSETQGNEAQAVIYRGRNPKAAEENFNKNQEKYLDMGHIKTLILGTGILKNQDALEGLLEYLEEKPSVGANMYVLVCKDVNGLMSLDAGESVGDYLSGILENNLEGKAKQAVMLQDLYNAYHRKEKMPDIPEVTVVNKKPQISQYS